MNRDITSLQTLVAALESADFITSVSPVDEGGEILGYTVNFSHGTPITVYHGKNGNSPVIGVQQDADATYYWTLNGEWLLDADGKKLRIIGQDGEQGETGAQGITPQLKIENGYWQVSYDNGGTWTQLDKAVGENGQDGAQGITPQLKIENGYWQVSYDNGGTWTQLDKAVGENGQDGEQGETGAQGITPRLKIENDYWYLSYDNGDSWVQLDKATGEDGDSMFERVDVSDPHAVLFVLADGTEIRIPRGVVRPTGIIVLSERVSLGAGTQARCEFRVNPSNATVDFQLDGENRNLQLDRISSRIVTRASYVTDPVNYRLVSVEPSKNDMGEIKQGQYVAVIEDAGLATSYSEQAALVLTTFDENGNTCQLSSLPFEISFATGTELLSVAIGDAEAVRIDEETFQIKLPYETDLKNLHPKFSINGASITLKDGGEVETADFSNPVWLSVTAADGAMQDYRVVVHYSNLPILYITTPSPIESKDEWTNQCSIEIWNAGEENGIYADVQMKGRGNTTWGFSKKPYAIKLDKKEKVLGMPKHKRWVLLANYLDGTYMRNAVAFEIARRLPGLAWTPRGRFVDVVVNGEMQGNYYLCEHIKIDENRVNIAEIAPDDIAGDAVTGGYIFELDINYDELYKFETSHRNLPVMFKDPDEDIADEQLSYVQNYFNTIEDILYGGNLGDENVFDYIDMDSFIDWWLVHELSFNGEPYWPKSSYMNKDRNGKLMAGPVWDFDYGTFRLNNGIVVADDIWYGELFKKTEFVARVKERWNLYKEDLESVSAFIDETAADISESAAGNRVKWNIPNGDPNWDTNIPFSEAVAQMKQAYLQRIACIDAYITGL